jgi:DNA adenine methylase
MKMQKPFIKWVGGKHKLLTHIINKIPKQFNSYHDIFLGGGSVLLAILTLQANNKITINGTINAYDLNERLINTFKQIKNNPKLLILLTKNLVKQYEQIKINTHKQKGAPEFNKENYTETREHFYYWICHKFNTTEYNTTLNAAYFIFLNKTGFRGMFRENSDGGFNIPFGLKDRKTLNFPNVIIEDEIITISQLIQKVHFHHLDFENSIKKVKKDDFVYLDPPYVPEDKKSFVGYNACGFDLETHNKLFTLINKFNNKQVKFIMSNSNTDLVNNIFNAYNKEIITARRAINSKNPAAKTTELVIFNS